MTGNTSVAANESGQNVAEVAKVAEVLQLAQVANLQVTAVIAANDIGQNVAKNANQEVTIVTAMLQPAQVEVLNRQRTVSVNAEIVAMNPKQDVASVTEILLRVQRPNPNANQDVSHYALVRHFQIQVVFNRLLTKSVLFKRSRKLHGPVVIATPTTVVLLLNNFFGISR
jgi:hypothetical protein